MAQLGMFAVFAILTTGVIFGGKGVIRRWVHKRRVKRNDRFKRRAEELYKRRFKSALTEIEHWRRETEPKREKHVNVVCKNPAIAPAFKY